MNRFWVPSLFLLAIACLIGNFESYSQSLLITGDFSFAHSTPSFISPESVVSHNSKSVDKTEIEIQQLSTGVWLNYRIRFQNDGNSPAVNIKIKDSLSSFLDFNTFQFTGSSHSGQFSLYTSGNLYINYNLIYLPDSSTNFSGSQGSFRFRIKVKDNLSIGNAIDNFAEIQMDQNANIITNTVQTIIVNHTSVFDFDNYSYSLYPNPVYNNLYIDFSENLSPQKVEIMNMKGQLIDSDKGIIDGFCYFYIVSELPTGIYFIRIYHASGVASSKFIKN